MVVEKKRLIWSKMTKADLKTIAEYYKKEASITVAKRITEAIRQEARRLIEMPFIGQLEPSLNNDSYIYRYLVCKHYKLIYYVKGNSVVIICIFDCRQDPDRLKHLFDK